MASSNAGGYEHEFLESTAKLKEFECPLCLFVTREPHLTLCCGQDFCQSCINRIVTDRKPCPFCKANSFIVILDKKQKRKALELKVKCTMKERGCDWSGELGKLDTHMDTRNGSCQFVDVNCPNNCGESHQRRHLANHLSDLCPKRPFTCEYCQFKATYEQVCNDHYPRCVKYPVPCPNKCEIETVKRGNLKQHVSECPLQVVECHLGCNERMKREGLPKHVRVCPKRPFTCQYCQFKATYEQVCNDHYPKCVKYPVPCSNKCEIGAVERGNLEQHVSECHLQVVECEFAHAGCSEKITRKDLPKHMELSMQKHLVLVSSYCVKEMTSVREKLDQKVKQLTELQGEIAETKKDTATKLDQLRERQREIPETKKPYLAGMFVFSKTPQSHFPVIWRCLEIPLMVPFVDTIDVLTCDSSGREFTNTDHDITLRIPPGAIPDGVTIHIEAGVALHGPFQFPLGTRPISPIVWLCMQEGILLLKPVEVILPHLLNDWEVLRLGFLKADHTTYTTGDGEKRYMFQPVNGSTEFYPEDGRGFGVLSTKHFCFLCIQANITRDQLPSKAWYCLSHVIPDPWPPMQIVPIHFCVTFFMETCFQTLVKQFPSGVRISRRKFMFQDPGLHNLKPKLRIEDYQSGSGWTLALTMGKAVKAADVDYWDKGGTKNHSNLQLMEKEKMYPPRLTVEACGSSATESSVAQVRFTGSCEDEDLYTEVSLPHPVTSAFSATPPQSANSITSTTSSVGGGYAPSGFWSGRDYCLEGKRPSLVSLLKFPVDKGYINIPERIGPNHNFGVFLLDDETGAIVDGIVEKQQRSTDDINTAILKKWLQGRGKQPVFWRTLIEVLRDSQLSELADEIQRNLCRLT